MLTFSSPAKINLFLRILGKRPDGYHEIASLFQTIDLCDEMHFSLSENDVLICSDHTLPVDESNLVAKARKLFRNKTGINKKFAINLKKNIPQQAGLGGGSSNAATTLWALNVLSGNPATVKELAEWGAEIGSDIAFFLSCGSAFCTGRGEIVYPVDPPKNETVWIVKPPIGLSTPLVYKELGLHTANFIDRFKGVPDKQALNNNMYINDLEFPALKLIPELELLKKKLSSFGFHTVLMSGSGSSFFCIGEGSVSELTDCHIFKSQFLNRKSGAWY